MHDNGKCLLSILESLKQVPRCAHSQKLHSNVAGQTRLRNNLFNGAKSMPLHASMLTLLVSHDDTIDRCRSCELAHSSWRAHYRKLLSSRRKSTNEDHRPVRGCDGTWIALEFSLKSSFGFPLTKPMNPKAVVSQTVHGIEQVFVVTNQNPGVTGVQMPAQSERKPSGSKQRDRPATNNTKIRTFSINVQSAIGMNKN